MSEDPLLDRFVEHQEDVAGHGAKKAKKAKKFVPPYELHSKEMLNNAYGTLHEYHDGWLKDRAFLLEFWRKNTLLKHVSAAASGEKDDTDKEDVELIMAGMRDYNNLRGLKLMVYGQDITASDAKELARQKEAIFVVNGNCEIPAWVEKRYAHLVVVYDHAEITDLHVAELKCVEFSKTDRYQVLAEKPTKGQVSWEQWEDAKAAGERSQLPKLPSHIAPSETFSRLRPADEAGRRGDSGGPPQDLFQPTKVGREAVEERLGGSYTAEGKSEASNVAVTSQGRGMATMLGDIELGGGHKKADVAVDGSEGGHKRKRSEDDGPHSADAESEDDEGKAPQRPNKFKHEGAALRNIQTHAVASRAQSPIPSNPKVKAKKPRVEHVGPTYPPETSHVEPGSAAINTEVESGNAWAGSWRAGWSK